MALSGGGDALAAHRGTAVFCGCPLRDGRTVGASAGACGRAHRLAAAGFRRRAARAARARGCGKCGGGSACPRSRRRRGGFGLGGGGRHRRSVHVPAVALLFRVHEGGRDLRSARGILCYRLGALPSNGGIGLQRHGGRLGAVPRAIGNGLRALPASYESADGRGAVCRGTGFGRRCPKGGGGPAVGGCRCGASPWGSGRRGESRAPESAHRRGPCPVLVLLLPLVRHRPVQWGGSDRGLHGGAGGHDCAGGYLRGLLQVRPSARSTLPSSIGPLPRLSGLGSC